MSELERTRTPVASKCYACDICGNSIKKGDFYAYSICKCDLTNYTLVYSRLHLSCYYDVTGRLAQHDAEKQKAATKARKAGVL